MFKNIKTKTQIEKSILQKIGQFFNTLKLNKKANDSTKFAKGYVLNILNQVITILQINLTQENSTLVIQIV